MLPYSGNNDASDVTAAARTFALWSSRAAYKAGAEFSRFPVQRTAASSKYSFSVPRPSAAFARTRSLESLRSSMRPAV